MSRDRDNNGVGRPGGFAHLAYGAQAIQYGHAPIDKNNMRPPFFEHMNAFAAIRGLAKIEPERHKQVTHKQAIVQLIFNDENFVITSVLNFQNPASGRRRSLDLGVINWREGYCKSKFRTFSGFAHYGYRSAEKIYILLRYCKSKAGAFMLSQLHKGLENIFLLGLIDSDAGILYFK